MEAGNNPHTLTYQRAWFELLQATTARPAKLSAQTPAEEKALAWDATTARVALPALVTARLGRREEACALLAQVMPHGERTLFASNRADLQKADKQGPPPGLLALRDQMAVGWCRLTHP